MIYEERRVRLQPGMFAKYRTWALEGVFPSLSDAGQRPLCLLNGLIGAAPEDVLMIIGFDNYDQWQFGQSMLSSAVSGRLVEHESVRLLTPMAARPDPVTDRTHRRNVYGVRRWWIDANDWLEFNKLSLEGVWPAFDHMGHHTLGQFRDAATTAPLEVVNLAGYDDVAMWQTTRDPAKAGVPDELTEACKAAQAKRRALATRTEVVLMTAHWSG